MRFDPEKHHRRSIRLKGYDYAQAGLYFITICVTDMECFFGSVQDSKMVLNDAGKVVEKWYFELSNKFTDIELGDFVVMPNHFHAIIINNGKGNTNKKPVGADLCVRPTDAKTDKTDSASADHIVPNGDILGEHTGSPLHEKHIPPNDDILGEHTGSPLHEKHIVPNGDILGEHTGSPLHEIVQWFKTMSTNEYIRGVKDHAWPRFRGKLWQRNYYEHIIRSQRSFENISGYIANNPGTWEEDKFYRR